MENKKLSKGKKFREILAYVFFGFLLGLDLLAGYFLWGFRSEFFSLAIDWTRTIEVGFVVVKGILLVVVIIINLKGIKGVISNWKKYTYVKVKETREGEKEYKRMGFIRRLIFYWRVNGARKWMDKYHEHFMKMQKMIGRIKGNETKELRKLKAELIKGILVWEDDFKITQVRYDKKGNEIVTNIPVDEKFLNDLYLEDLYEIYAVRGLETASVFTKGVSPFEKEELI